MGTQNEVITDVNKIVVSFVTSNGRIAVKKEKGQEVIERGTFYPGQFDELKKFAPELLSQAEKIWTPDILTAYEEEIEAAKLELESQIVKESVSDLEITFAEYVVETEQRLTDLEEKINA